MPSHPTYSIIGAAQLRQEEFLREAEYLRMVKLAEAANGDSIPSLRRDLKRVATTLMASATRWLAATRRPTAPGPRELTTEV
jgi:hypothetical protein